MEAGERGGYEGAADFQATPDRIEELTAEQLDCLSVVSDYQIIREGLTYDDVNIKIEATEVRGEKLRLESKLTRNIELRVPLISAAMDTVTESEMAIAMAREGGVGVIHKNLSPEKQAEEVERVKRASSALIEQPERLRPDATVEDFLKIREQKNIGSVMIVDQDNRLLGMVTKRQLRPLLVNELINRTEDEEELLEIPRDVRLQAIMYEFGEEEILPPGSTQQDAMRLFALPGNESVDRLPVVGVDGKLEGLYTVKDIIELAKYPMAAKDAKGRLLVGAAVGVGEDLEQRLELLAKAEVDFITIDSAHGHDAEVINAIRWAKERYPEIDVIAGNVATAEATRALIKAGADAIKVGIGPGAICTTRKVTGVGMSQLAAIRLACLEAKDEVPIIADGGIKEYGDVCKALVAGADAVMMGSMLAGVSESASESLLIDGKRMKAYRGMGSKGAIKDGSGSRYHASGSSENGIVPEGIEGAVPEKGPLHDTFHQLRGSIEKALFYTGSVSVKVLRQSARFTRASQAGQAEGHVHDVRVTSEAPNYSHS